MPTLYVSSGVSSSGLTVSGGQQLEVLSSGWLYSTVIQSGGSLAVDAGGEANGITVSSGGELSGNGVIDGNDYIAGTISDVYVGVAFDYVNVEVLSGGFADNLVVRTGNFRVDPGAAATGTQVYTLLGGNGPATIRVSGVSSDTNVGSDGLEMVWAGGVSISATVNSGGSEQVLVGGEASAAVVTNGGLATVYSGGEIAATTISSGGNLSLWTGATAADVEVLSGAAVELAPNVSSGQVLSTISGIVTRTVQIDGVIVLSGGLLDIDAGAVLSGGLLIAASGQSIGDLTVSAGAELSGAGVVIGNESASSWDAGVIVGVSVGRAGGTPGALEVASGGVASAVGVYEGALTIDAGAMTVGGGVSGPLAGDDVYGVAQGATVDSGGELIAETGGFVNGTIVQGGHLLVSSNGIASGGLIDAGGTEYVVSGGVVDGAVIGSGGVLSPEAGAVLADVTVSSGGMIEYNGPISAGEIVMAPVGASTADAEFSGVTLLPGAIIFVDGATVLSGGVLSLGLGTSATNLSISSGGLVAGAGVLMGGNFDRGLVSGLTIGTGSYDDESLTVWFGGIAEDVVIDTAASLDVLSGGTASGSVLASAAREYVDQSGVSVSAFIGNGGAQIVNQGGVASGAVVMGGGYQDVVGQAFDTIVSNGGLLEIWSGATTSGVLVSSGGFLQFGGAIGSGHSVTAGFIEATVVDDGVTCLSGADVELEQPSVLNGGSLTVAAFTSVPNIYVSAGGTLLGPGEIDGRNGVAGTVSGIALGDTGNSATLTLSANAIADAVTVVNGLLTVDAAAIASETVLTGSLNFNEADIYGTAVATDVGALAAQVIENGGQASGTTVGAGGYEIIDAGGAASGSRIGSGGHEVIAPGAAAVGVIVSSGGAAYISQTVSAHQTVSARSVAFSTTIGGITILSGGFEDAGFDDVESGGTLVLATGAGGAAVLVEFGGQLKGPGILIGDNLADGIASGVSVGSGAEGGQLEIGSAGVASNVVVGDGDLLIDFGGAASGTRLSQEAVISVQPGVQEASTGITAAKSPVGVIDSASLQPSDVVQNEADVHGAAFGTVVSSGAIQLVEAGGSASATHVLSGGFEIVEGITSGAVVSSGGGEVISYGAIASAVTVEGGGVVYFQAVVSSGQTFESEIVGASTTLSGVTVQSGGSLDVYNGTVLTGGVLSVASGGLVDELAVSSGGTIEGAGALIGSAMIYGAMSGVQIGEGAYGGQVQLQSYGTATNVEVDNGELEIDEGAQDDGAVLQSGSIVSVLYGGVASSLTVSSGGWLVAQAGAIISGLSLEVGAVIDVVDVSATSASVVGSNLVVTSGGTTVDTLGLSGSGSNLGFSLTGDGSFGTLITVTSSVAQTPPPSAFAGGGLSDLLWRNSNGDVGVWLTGSGGGYTPVDLGIIPTSWTIDGAADVNGDGKADLLWRNTNGDVGVWLSNAGSGYAGFTPVELGIIPTSWAIAGSGDFNGDGKADILWRNTNGDVGEWLSNAGSGYSGFTSIDMGIIPSSWSIDGVGDFTGGSKSDILWRNSNGDVGLWLSNTGSGYTGYTPVDLGVIPTSWSIEGIGDFNGDGKADILWRNSNGDVGVWLSNSGSGYAGFTSVDFGVIDSSWSIQGVGDYNGDGKADLLWRNSNGDVGEWLSKSGSGYTGFTAVDLGTIPTSWSITDTTAPSPPPPNASLFVQTMASMTNPASTAVATQPPATPPPTTSVLAVVN